MELVGRLINERDEKLILSTDEDGISHSVYIKHVAPECGVVLVGHNVGDHFMVEYYYPYSRYPYITSNRDCKITRMSDNERYMASCEDSRFGINAIFYMSNFADIFKYKIPLDEEVKVRCLSLSALAKSARILSPIEKSPEVEREMLERRSKRVNLVDRAQNGDDEAFEQLTSDEMKMYQRVNHRVWESDLYSVVDSFFMPSGMECDQYCVMGQITDIEEHVNSVTGNRFYRFNVKTNNDMRIGITVAASDVIGEPKTGRRIKCDVWLQGEIEF